MKTFTISGPPGRLSDRNRSYSARYEPLIHFQTEINRPVTGLRGGSITNKRVIGTNYRDVTAGTNHQASVTEVASDLVQTLDTDGTLFHDKLCSAASPIFATTHPVVLGRSGSCRLSADRDESRRSGFQAARVLCTSRICHFRWGFTHAEEVHKAGSKLMK